MFCWCSLQKTGFVIDDPLQLAVQLGRWLALGQLGHPDFNGSGVSSSVSINLWTLNWEWRFYALLPLAALFWSGTRFLIMFVLAGIIIAALPHQQFLFNFLAGMMTAVILARFGPISFAKRSFVGLASLAPIALTLFVWPQSYGLAQTLSLLPLFFLIASGETLFGLLTNKAARVLGAMSYSIYLVHLIVLYVAFHASSVALDLASLPLPLFWVWIAATGAILIGLCSITYRFVELPWIAVGHKVATRMRPATQAAAAAI